MTGVVIEERTYDHIASIEEEPGKWESGRNEEEAIGELVLSHPELFNVGNIEKELHKWGSTGVNLRVVGRLITTDPEHYGVELKIKFRGHIYGACQER
ncbi:hypothetical protein KAU33_02265 [Candidatus Dependentiae bacterium]|nr:hypothetical protein [Candidatus Dependentiae bacterium]